ncbi:DUF4268 domain-containing protein [Halobacillus salinarum]|uniref:DUF4268 domain-containing protein n=1 Tax=Halobacillus salinarum TaxID=2932257 RepID=A0ABY4EPP2_9BACI|nr:DUF4268 domain-containing protein [Halobacillus salinarum]UOQ44066.1 DUF4268 domain-containing protein [Halobacillus salinarum]
MFIIDRKSNRITKLNQKTFSELGFRERDHLQEWIANNPESIGEELLIIQKEFNGFHDTNERLDLLALDKQGNVVVIENKLDDSGRDVTWQVLKYASYCSSLTKEQIKSIYQDYLNKISKNEEAEKNLIEFFEVEDYQEIVINKGLTQRLIIIAANFRKEVTSTVLWLMNYKLRIQCFKVTPYQMGDQLLLNFEQIIPMKEAEEYVINMAEKNQADINIQEESKTRHNTRILFWKKLLPHINKKTELFKNISPSKDNWIGAGTGISSVSYNFVMSRSYARVEVYLQRSVKEENKFIFEELGKFKDSIENKFGDSLTWERLDNKKASRIKYQKDDVNIYNEEDWEDMINFMVTSMLNLENAFQKPISEVRSKLISKLNTDEI